MFKREHHQRLARVFDQLAAVKLRRLNCFFAGSDLRRALQRTSEQLQRLEHRLPPPA